MAVDVQVEQAARRPNSIGAQAPKGFRPKLLQVARYALIGLAVAVAGFPLLFLLLTSLRPPGEFLATPPRMWPSSLTLVHFEAAFGRHDAGQFLVNSLIVTSVTTIVSIVTGTLAAYSLARSQFRTWILGAIIFVFIFVRFYPRIATVVPWFLVVRDLGMLDTVWAVIFGHLGITIPFVTWLMFVMFRDIPQDLEESAAIEGASLLQRFFYVVLPVATPGVASAAIFTAFLSWNEFLIASAVTRQDASTLPIAVAGFVTDKGVLWGPMSAMSVVILIPMVIFALTVQRYLVKGLMLGAVKG